MDKPNALMQLVDELKYAVEESSVIAVDHSWAKIYLNRKDPIVLDREEAELLFHSPNTVEQLFQALDEPLNATVSVHDIILEDEVQDCLERLFDAVDDE